MSGSLVQAVVYRKTFEERPDGVLDAGEWQVYQGTEDRVGTITVDGPGAELDQEDLRWLRETFEEYRIRSGHVDGLRVVVDA